MRRMVRLAMLAGAILTTAGAQALVLGGTNLGIFGYPEAECRRPDPPRRPFSPATSWDIQRYNTEVDMYNLELQRFVDCTKTYLENARNDMKRIRERMDEALERAQR